MKGLFRITILFLLFVSSGLSQSQNNITGRLTDPEGNPVIFANIGILNKGIGTVSDEYGYFTLNFGNEFLNDTMAISCIGYKYSKYVVSSFINAPAMKHRNFIVEKEIVQLQTVTIAGKKMRSYKTGYFTNSWNIRGFMTSKAKGAELATLIDQQAGKTIHLLEFQFNIVKNDFDSLRYRINIYSVQNGMPDSNLLKGNEVFLLLKDHDKFTYRFKKDIFTTGSFIVSLELLDTFGQSETKKRFEFTAQQGGVYYCRLTSHAKWEKVAGVSLGYGLLVN